MWITGLFKGNTVYPHVDRLCIDNQKLFTFNTAKLSTGHLILSIVFEAVHLIEEVLRFFHVHG